MPFSLLVESYLLARPDMERRQVEHVIAGAVERAREKHADFDRFLPAMEFLGSVFFTDHRRMPLDDFLETLYCGVKHADYARPWRLNLKRSPAFGQHLNKDEPPVQ